MTLKQAAATFLLAFVAVTCVVLIVRAVGRPQPAAPGTPDLAGPASAPKTPGSGSPAPAPADGVHVYYLHGDVRCPTCRTIEAYAKEAVETGFASELQSGKVTWQVVNYDQPENRRYSIDYQVVAPTVVITKWEGGKQVDWRNLSEVWEYVGDKPAFLALVQRHLREMLAQPAHGPASAAGSPSSPGPAPPQALLVPGPLPLDPERPATSNAGGSGAPLPR